MSIPIITILIIISVIYILITYAIIGKILNFDTLITRWVTQNPPFFVVFWLFMPITVVILCIETIYNKLIN